MKRSIAYGCLLAAISVSLVVGPARADSLKLKNGQAVEGKYLGGTDSRIDFLVAGRVQSYNVTDVQSLTFEGKPYGQAASASLSSAARASSAADTQASAPAASATSSPSSASSITMPAGTTLTVRMIDGVDSNANKIGDRFNASLESDLAVNGEVVALKGADVYGRLIQAKEAGSLGGQSELRLELTGIKIGGRVVPIVTGAYEVSGSSRGKSTAEKVGGGAAIGAIIGAIAGGGRGAAIGAGVGAGAGTAVQVLTHGQQVHVPSETVLNFTLAQPATVPVPADAAATSRP